ncbi:predicted protein [Nematostella vectensis]|uniref:Coiled-coil domain-containing protein 60 n=1 Tax=Nematostella vectensis TaxID=45351 RepID=A7RSQ3_NEMVE|nr:predicted protein [Nematostella vectensis]|eukprot:XP_001637521.1 predicted protein [Nematostella vectensis]
MPETDNPRAYIQSKPLPITSHQGLKITARSARVYTCEVPTRREVARENYERRKHQMTKCGYRSVIYKPYQSVGEVFLNDKKLILSALGQQASEQVTQFQDNSSSSSSDSEDDEIRTFKNSRSPTKSKADHQKPVVPQATAYKPEVINDIRVQVNKGRKMVNAVRLGFGLYRLVKDEQEKKQAKADEEQRKKEEAARREMKPPTSDSENSDDENDELRSLIIQLPPSPTHDDNLSPREYHDVDPPGSPAPSTTSQKWKRLGQNAAQSLARDEVTPRDQQPMLHVTKVTPPDTPEIPDYDRSSTEHLTISRTHRQVASAPSERKQLIRPPKSAQSTSSAMSRRSRKLRNPRPYSPVYSNINYNDVADRQSVFRQLCVLHWILEAMSQDVQPAVMPPITSCWKLKELKENINNLRKRVERDKNTEKDWVTFKQNPARFTQRNTRRGTRRISIHPNFLQRLTNNNTPPSSGSNPTYPTPVALRIPQGDTPRSRRGSACSNVSHTENEPAQGQRNEAEDSSPLGVSLGNHGNHARFVGDSDVKNSTDHVSAPASPQTPATPSQANVADKKAKLQKQKSFTVTSVYTPPTNASKAIQKLRAKTRAAKAFKTNLSQKELDKLSTPAEEQRDSRVRAWVQATGAVNTKRFAAAAIAAFGAITLDHNKDKIPTELKSKFDEVAEEKALVLHDNLEVRDRNRMQILERKLMCLETFNNMYKALDQMRSNSVIPDNETSEEMRQRVSEECKWYKDLNDNLPPEVKNDMYCNLVLNKIASYGSLEGRKASSSQFLKVLSTLRMWEICAPDISAALEFVREKVVGMSEIEYEDWFNMKFPQPQRAVSAPPPRTGQRAY